MINEFKKLFNEKNDQFREKIKNSSSIKIQEIISIIKERFEIEEFPFYNHVVNFNDKVSGEEMFLIDKKLKALGFKTTTNFSHGNKYIIVSGFGTRNDC